jgi:crossover junction endodeoxyribonuclease RuvC
MTMMSLRSTTTPNSATVIIGIDPGTAITGYGVLSCLGQHLTVIEYGVIRTLPSQTGPDRLVTLYQKLTALLSQYQPTQAGCEKLFFAKNVKTAGEVGQARGIILLALAQFHVTISELTPPQVKQAVTGYGSADKQQVQYMTKKILGLQTIPRPDDAADALAIAIATASQLALHKHL